MAFDGSIFENLPSIILALPGAIKDLKDLVSGSKQTDKQAVAQIEKIQNYLISFEEVNGWLMEAKNLHDSFQALDTAFEPIRSLIQSATAYGPMNIQEFKITEVRKYWNGAKNHSLIKIFTLAKTMKKIENEPLVLKSNGEYISGPEWAKRLHTLGSNIDQCFVRYDKGDQNIVGDLIAWFIEINNLEKEHMHLLNERIKNEAAELSQNFVRLAGSLKNV